jgi:hypothetical protein
MIGLSSSRFSHIKDILHKWMSGGYPRGKIGKILIRREVLEIL